MTSEQRKVKIAEIRKKYGITDIFAKESNDEAFVCDEGIKVRCFSDYSNEHELSQIDKRHEKRIDTETNINKFHESHRPEHTKLVDIDAVCKYNKEERKETAQVIEFPKKGVGRFNMKQPDRFKTQWFQDLYVSIQDRKVGHTSPLSERELKNSMGGLVLPAGYTLAEVLDAIRYRQREYRKKIMPVVKNEKEFEVLPLLEFRPALNMLLSHQGLNQTISALSRIYLKFLKENFSSDPKNGIKNLKSIWSIRVQFLKPQVIAAFDVWQKKQDPSFHGSDISKIRGLSSLIFERTSNPTRTRATKHSVFSPEIEDLLQKFKGTAYAGKQGKNIICHAREAIKLAEISKASELKSTKALEKIVELNHRGLISDAHASRIKPFFYWLGAVECGFKVPGFFEKKKIETIYEITEHQKEWFERNIRNLLVANGYKVGSTKRTLDLYRWLMSQLNSRGVVNLTDAKPSDFICAAALGARNQRNLGTLRGIVSLSASLLDYSSQKNKWTLFTNETFEEFQEACLPALDDCGDKTLETLNLTKYRHCFDEGNRTWKSFLNLLVADYHLIAHNDEIPRRGTRAAQKDLVGANHYGLLYEKLLVIAHGEKCGNRKTGAIKDQYGDFRTGGLLDKEYDSFSKDDARVLEKYTAFALQAFGGLRFRSESDAIVFFEKAPVLTKNTCACLFPKTYKDDFLGETTALALYQPGENRKNDLAYLVPLSTLADEFLIKHLAVQNIKHGQKVFTLGVSTLADEIKRISCQWFDANVSLEELKTGQKANKAFTTHRYRNMVLRAIERYYKGHDSAPIQAVILGQKLNRDAGSSTTEIYADYIGTCEKYFSTIRRLKDQIYKTDLDFQNEKLQEKLHQMTEENRQARAENKELHTITQDGIQDLKGDLEFILKDQLEAHIQKYMMENPMHAMELMGRLIANKNK